MKDPFPGQEHSHEGCCQGQQKAHSRNFRSFPAAIRKKR